jgi:nucleotide-binding universal stress UspA family protein
MSGIERWIVAGVDGSEPALMAVRWAAVEASRRGLPLRLVNACPWPEHRGLGVRGPRLDYAGAFQQLAREQLAAAASAAQAHVPGIAVETEVVGGDPIDVLVEQSRRAELLVLGDRGLGGVSGLLVGSVAIALTVHARCPVVIARGALPDVCHPLLPVVAGVDGSPASDAATGFAFEIAAARQVPLIAVRAWHDDPPLPATLSPSSRTTSFAEQPALLEHDLAGWLEKFPAVEVVRVVAHERPARLLLREAAGAQLVAVGCRGRGAFAGLVLGSVSHALIQHALCPVAVFRAPSTPDHVEGE